jgi:dTDP-4-amino-4,6-dideoxygalactose transaminase
MVNYIYQIKKVNNRKIKFSGPDIIDIDYQSVNEVLKSGWLAHGKFSRKLEDLPKSLINHGTGLKKVFLKN